MKKNATLYMLCGKMAAGKTTLAREISADCDALLISEDDLLAKLYPGEVIDISSYVKFSEKIKSAIAKPTVDLLILGTSVVLDFPANTVQQRAWLVALAAQANAPHELHYIDRPDSSCLTQLQKRATEFPERAATDTPKMFAMIGQYFQTPSEEEGLNIRLRNRS